MTQFLKGTNTIAIDSIKVKFNTAILEDLSGNKLENAETMSLNPMRRTEVTHDEAETAKTTASVGVFSVILAIVTGMVLVFLLGMSI